MWRGIRARDKRAEIAARWTGKDEQGNATVLLDGQAQRSEEGWGHIKINRTRRQREIQRREQINKLLVLAGSSPGE
jgi:hypothetical protein